MDEEIRLNCTVDFEQDADAESIRQVFDHFMAVFKKKKVQNCRVAVSSLAAGSMGVKQEKDSRAAEADGSALRWRCHRCPNEHFQSETEFVQHCSTHKVQNKELEYRKVGNKFGCSKCFKKFARKYHLKTHMRVHTQEKPFKCNTCKNRFGYKSTLSKHVGKFHADPE